MILKSENVNIYQTQDTLYDYIQDHNQTTSGWYTDPGGLRNALNHFDVGNLQAELYG